MPPQTPGQDTPAATPITQAPPQEQSFDYLADMRKRYPKLQSAPDDYIWHNLGKPETFRQVYPKYKDLDDITIQKNIERLSKLHPQAQAATPAAPPTKPPAAAQMTPVTGRPPVPGTAVTPQPAAATPDKAAPPQAPPQQPYVPPQERQHQTAQKALADIPRPKWDTPQAIAQDPTWYGRTVRYAGGELIGTAKAATGVMVGGTKLIHDIASALDPFEGQKRALGDPQAQVGRDIVDIGKGTIDLGRLVWEMMKSNDAAADPEAFGSTILQAAMTVDGGLEAAKALKASGAPAYLNKARVGVYNSAVKQGAVEKAYVHKNGVKIAEEEFLKAESKAKAHVKEHVDNLTTKIGNKPVDITSTVQKIKTESAKQIKTVPPGQVARRTGIPTAVPSPLDEVIAYANSVAPGTWTWETVKQFRTEVGHAMTRATGPELKVLTDIYVNDLTPKLANVARQYQLVDSWTAYNTLEKALMKGWPILEKARTIVEGNGEGAAMAQAIKNPAALKEVLTSLKPWGIDSARVLKYAAKANKILRESNEYNQSMFRYVYRLNPAAAASIPMMMIGRQAGGWMGGLAAGAITGLGINFLMHTIRAMTLEPAYLEEVLPKRQWPGPTPIPAGAGYQTPGPQPPGAPPQLPGGGPTPGAPGPTGPVNPPPVPGTAPPTGPAAPPAPVPGGAPPSPVAAAAAKVAEPPPAAPRTKGRPPKAKTESPVERRLTQNVAARNLVDTYKKKLKEEEASPNPDPNVMNVLRRSIEETQKDPSTAGGGEELDKKIQAAREIGKKAMEAAPEAKGEPKVTKVPEGVSGREAGARPGTTRETPLVRKTKQAKRVAEKRAEKGATALGGGGLEVTGGGAGEAAIKAEADKAAQRSAAAPQRPITERSLPELEESLQELAPDKMKELQQWRKEDKSITGEMYLSGLRYEVIVAEDQASAMRQERAEALIKESEGRKLSPSEKKIQKELKKKEN